MNFTDSRHRAAIELERRKRRETREEELHEENLLDRRWERTERRERWELKKKGRYAKLKNSSWRERIGMGLSVIAFLCALAVLGLRLKSDQGDLIEVSGVVAIGILGMALRFLRLEQK